MENILFTDSETNETVAFYVLAETSVNGQTYLLVTEEEDGDADAFIMRQVSSKDLDEVDYEFVEDEDVLEALSKIFVELLEDTEVIF